MRKLEQYWEFTQKNLKHVVNFTKNPQRIQMIFTFINRDTKMNFGKTGNSSRENRECLLQKREWQAYYRHQYMQNGPYSETEKLRNAGEHHIKFKVKFFASNLFTWIFLMTPTGILGKRSNGQGTFTG